MKSTKFWVALIAGFLIFFAAASILLPKLLPHGDTAVVYLDGKKVLAINLGLGGPPYEMPVEGAAYGNVLEVAPGKIRMLHADCPDQICVKTGWVQGGSVPIVCLPSRLVVQIESGEHGSAAPDGVSK